MVRLALALVLAWSLLPSPSFAAEPEGGKDEPGGPVLLTPPPSARILPACSLPRLDAPWSGAPSVDAHLHVLPEALRAGSAASLLSAGLSEKALLISPSYLGPHSADRPTGDDPAVTLPALDEEVSATAARQPDRLIGLCGFDAAWSETETALAVASRCLGLPGMRGIKVRLASAVDIRQLMPVVERALSLPGVRVALVHLSIYEHIRRDASAPDYPTHVARDMAEVDAMAALMARHPHIQFILAHSGFGPSMTERLAERAAALSLRNHWVDSSFLIMQRRDFSDPSLFDCGWARAWRSLGIDRVLYGSDGIIGAEGHADPAVAAATEGAFITGNAYLGSAEKERIMRSNGLAFWALASAR